MLAHRGAGVELKNVEDIYPVSPMQEVMLLHALSSGDGDTLFNQFCYAIDQDIDTEAFQKAWDFVIVKHAALRTAFVWQDVPRPLQVVRQSATAQFIIEDWRAHSRERQRSLFDEMLAEDRNKGFDLRRAPLMRFTMCRVADDSWNFIWSNHHLILDRWCLSTVIDDVGKFYSSLLAGNEVEAATAPSFREYIDWIQRQDEAACKSVWREALHGFDRRTNVVCTDRPAEEAGADRAQVEIEGRSYDELVGFVRRHGLTLSSLAHGGWALVLNRLCSSQDVVFGATVAGRPPEIPNVEAIVGTFINNVPVRIRMPSATTVVDWLRDVQRAQYSRSAVDYASPAEIQACSDIDDARPLFDSLIVWIAGDDAPHGLSMRPMSVNYGTAYPLTLSVRETADRLMLRADRRDDAPISPEELVAEWRSRIEQISRSAPEISLGDLTGFCRDPRFETIDEREKGRSIVREVGPRRQVTADQVRHGRESFDADVLRELLLTEWHRVLGSCDLEADTDFFEAGGDSLQAAQLHTRVEEATRQAVPMLALFEHPTVEGMARTLMRQDWPLRVSFSVPIRSKGHGVPLFCVASPEVNTIGYSLLARGLPAGQRVYLLQAPPDSDSVRRLVPVELPALAERYVSEMRRIQPAAPYRLLSMCAGSHIALEMTRQLESQNVHVDFLGIINTWGLYTVSRRYYVYRLMKILGYYAERLARLVPARSKARASAPANTSNQRASEEIVMPPEYDTGGRSPWIHEVGFERCDPGLPKISSTLTVFRNNSTQPFRIRDDQLGWSKQASTVQVVRLPGDDHDAVMREPYVRDLADAVAQSLASLSPDGDAPNKCRQRAA